MLGEENVKVVARYFGTLCIFAGAILRPVGGAIADKLGGTALIKTLGWSKGAFDGYNAGFVIFAVVVIVAIAGISLVKTRWRTTWEIQAGGRI